MDPKTAAQTVLQVEQCANGAVYCQIIDACHPGVSWPGLCHGDPKNGEPLGMDRKTLGKA